MAGTRQPTKLVLAKGRKHMTKDEIAERLSSEVHPCTDGIAAPAFLTATQKKAFDKIAQQLDKLGIMGETDCDTLARYIVAQSLYEQAVKDQRQLWKDKPKDREAEGYYKDLELWFAMADAAEKRIDRYFKQAQAAARCLSLTITDRCRLVVPAKEEEAPKVNKFARFGGGA
jgi:P27 family predicted phage terminase small subunit